MYIISLNVLPEERSTLQGDGSKMTHIKAGATPELSCSLASKRGALRHRSTGHPLPETGTGAQVVS